MTTEIMPGSFYVPFENKKEQHAYGVHGGRAYPGPSRVMVGSYIPHWQYPYTCPVQKWARPMPGQDVYNPSGQNEWARAMPGQNVYNPSGQNEWARAMPGQNVCNPSRFGVIKDINEFLTDKNTGERYRNPMTNVDGVTFSEPPTNAERKGKHYVLALRHLVEFLDKKERELFEYSSIGDRTKVEELLQEGVSVNVNVGGNDNDSTALIVASKNGHLEVVNVLLQDGADVNAVDRDGNTALIIASQNGRLEIVNVLLEKGADVNVVNKNGTKALDIARQNEHSEIVSVLDAKKQRRS